jgi:N6-L-threonylcarbamoyladenine synthase
MVTFDPYPAMPPLVRILGIESSCDETAAAIVEQGNTILSNIVASQIDLHAQFGGIFPEVASRQHVLVIYSIVNESLRQAHLTLDDLDAIAITRGPGLPGSLVVGLNMAKGLSLASGLPLIGINHLEAHIYSSWLQSSREPDQEEPSFPLVVLIVSGGHTELVLMDDHLSYKRLGSTLDDAAGEAFDKVARLLGLSYPGGPSIQKAAVSGNPKAYSFPRAWLEGSWDFSFSGVKTAVLREVQRISASSSVLPVSDLAASFQESVVEVLFKKTILAAREFEARKILVVGGVSSNRALRQAFEEQVEFSVQIPPLELCTDNAAMIAVAGHYRFLKGQRDPLDMDVFPNWPISEL